MKATDINFPMIPHESLWSSGSDPAKSGMFPKLTVTLNKKHAFSQALKTCFGHTFFSKSCYSKTNKDFSTMKPTPNKSPKYSKLSVKESRDNSSQSIFRLLKLEEWTQLIKKLTLFKRSQSRVINLSLLVTSKTMVIQTARHTISILPC